MEQVKNEQSMSLKDIQEFLEIAFITAYITMMTDKVIERNHGDAVDAYRKDLYQAAIELLKDHISPIPALNAAFDKYSKIRTAKQWAEEFTPEEDVDINAEFASFKLFMKDFKSMMTFVNKQSNAMATKLETATDKAMELNPVQTAEAEE